MSKFKKTAIIILAGLAIIITIYLAIAGKHTKRSDTYPSAIMNDMQSTTYNAQGALTRNLHAKKMLHYDDNNSNSFVEPRMQLKTSGGQTWFISAKKGLSSHGENKIELSENAIFHRPATKSTLETTISTNYAIIYPHKKIMTSNQRVRFIRPDTTIAGTGVIANLDNGMILIKSKVHALYDAQNNN